jgi:hypothetical protein
MVLPSNCGKDELLDRCFTILQTMPPIDYALEIIELIKANSNADEIRFLWFDRIPEEKSERTRWIDCSLRLGLLPQLALVDLAKVLSDAPYDAKRLNLLFRARRFDYLEDNEINCKAIIDAILNTQVNAQRQRSAQSIIELFAHVLDPHRYSVAFSYRQPIPLMDIWQKNPRGIRITGIQNESMMHAAPYDVLRFCIEIASVAEVESQRTAAEWASELGPWENIVEKSRSLCGDKWALLCLANVAAGIKSQKETCVDFHDLLDHSKSLCRRVRYARLRAGNASWWSKQIDSATSSEDVMLITLVLLTWGSSSTLIALARSIEDFINRLTLDNWYLLMESVQRTMSLVHEDLREGLSHFDLSSLPGELTDRTATAFGMRARREERHAFYLKYFQNYCGTDIITLEFCQIEALDYLNFRKPSWNPNLDLIARSYAAGAISDPYIFHRHPMHRIIRSFPITAADKIASNPDKYPNYLVTHAEATCKEIVASRIIPVGTIAEKEGWFAA